MCSALFERHTAKIHPHAVLPRGGLFFLTVPDKDLLAPPQFDVLAFEHQDKRTQCT